MRTAEQFWAKVQKTKTCWLWTAGRSGDYGCLSWFGKRDWAHRVAYILAFGKIDGETIDHLCRNPICVNPDHLEAVTCAENVLRGDGIAARRARQTMCKRGHELKEANVYHPPSRPRTRQCLLCIAIRALEKINYATFRNKDEKY